MQRSFALRTITLAEFTQLLRARRAEKFRGLCNSFARVGRKICVIPTRGAFLFNSECNTNSINSQRRCEVCAAHAGRVHAIFCARGRAGFPENFQIFRAIFAEDLRHLDALSYRVLSGNIGVVSEFENRQSRQVCMRTKINVEKASREAMHIS